MRPCAALVAEIKDNRTLFEDLFLCEKRYERFRVLKQCSDKQLNILLKTLNLIVNGHIPVRAKYKQIIKRSKRFPVLLKLEDDDDLTAFLEESRGVKLKYLKQISFLPQLFHNLFDVKS